MINIKLPGFPPGRAKRFIFGAALLFLLIFLAYLPALEGGFIWDDDYWVYENPHVRGEKSIWSIWHTAAVPGQNYPLTYTFFWAQCRLWGLNPFGYHFSNLLLHILNAFLLGLILRRLEIRAAWFTAAVFGLHPLMVESVAWITEAKNLLSAFFLFLAFLFFIRFGRRGRGLDYCLSLCLYLLALLSKTVICTFPLVMMLLIWYEKGKLFRRDIGVVLPFFVLSLVGGGFTWWYEAAHVGVRGVDWALPAPERILVAGRAFWFYLGKIVFPLKLSFIYPRWDPDPAAAVQWFFPVLAAAALMISWREKNSWGRGTFTALAAYALFILPALGFISFYAQIYSFVADHYTYLAIIAPLTFIISVFARLINSPGLKRIAGAFLLATLFFLTNSQSRIYRDLKALYRDTLKKNPRADMAHNNLGVVLFEEENYEEAISHYRAAIRLNPENAFAYNNLGIVQAEQKKYEEAVLAFSEAVRRKPNYAEAYFGLGSALEKSGQIREAISFYRRSLNFRPSLVPARISLGLARAKIGELEEAIAAYEKALEFEPDNFRAYNNLGLALAAAGRVEEAIERYEKALELAPDLEEAHANLVNAWAEQGEIEKAIRFYRRFLEKSPDNAQGHYNLAVALEKDGQTREAMEYYSRAVNLRPEYARARLNLGSLLHREGKTEEAVVQFQEAIRIDPGYAKAHYNLGIIYSERGDSEKARWHLEQAGSFGERLERTEDRGQKTEE